MTITEQIHAILEHKGWTYNAQSNYWVKPDGYPFRDEEGYESTPNLLDRQVCFDVFEKDADDGYWMKLKEQFPSTLFLKDNKISGNLSFIKVAKATPEQRIEAYVSHIGKWRD